MEALTKQQLEQLQAQLLHTQVQLKQQLSMSEAASDVVALDQTSIGRISRMDAMQQQSMAMSTRSKSKLKLQKVEAALRTFDSDEYGFCKRCEELIAVQRLQAQPEAMLCISCQNIADQQQ